MISNFRLLKTPQEMAILDQMTIDLGLPEAILMENAARSIWQILQYKFHNPSRKIIIFMGSGNNGGDGAALARSLQASGDQVLLLYTREWRSYKGSVGLHLRLARKFGVRCESVTKYPNKLGSDWVEPDLIVDALLGTGFQGELRPQYQEIIQTINQHSCPIVAIDIPSGLQAISGLPSPMAVRATLTVTLAAAKPGLVLPQAKPWVGELITTEIGIPQHLLQEQTSAYELLPIELLPRVEPEHKGQAGHVYIIGGSPGLSGAPQLSALAALRSGCGLVTWVMPAGLSEPRLPDIMTLPLKSSLWSVETIPYLAEQLKRAQVIVLGPGLGNDYKALEFLTAYLQLPNLPPQVIDASALELLAQRPELLKYIRPQDILTPHPGEAARLLATSNADIQADRFNSLAQLQKLAPCTWILKGIGTLISSLGQPIIISPFEVPNLAIAGSGDVLSGCVAYYLLSYSAHLAASYGVLHHALAGQALVKEYPRRGNLASEIANQLAKVNLE